MKKRVANCKPAFTQKPSQNILLFSLGYHFFHFRYHPFHHAFYTSLQCYHGRRATTATSLQHQVYGSFPITPELYGTAIHLNGRLYIVFQQFLYPLHNIVVIRTYRIAGFLPCIGYLLVIYNHTTIFKIFFQKLFDGRDHILPVVGIGSLGKGNEIAGYKNTPDKREAKQFLCQW